MSFFRTTTHLSKILEESEKTPVIIFKHSLKCLASDRLKESLEKEIEKKKILNPVYIVPVQDMPILSKNIEEVLNIKHESPQIIILNKTKSIYNQSHDKIRISDIVKV